MNREELTSLHVAVISGGWSEEREVSLSSASQVMKALDEAAFSRVELLDLADEGFVTTLANGSFDVAFVVMHGLWGEDGCLQGLLEILHIPYTFSGVCASAVATEKELAKAVYVQAGLATPRGISLAPGTKLTPEEAEDVFSRFGPVVFVKPAANGSSFGVSRVTRAEDLNNALAKASETPSAILIEECVQGTEISVPVIGNQEPEALPIVEIVTGAEFYDVKVKYEPSALHHVIPARLPEDVYAAAQYAAVAAHQALGCRGCSRSDFIVTEDGTPVILETNTIPGMTEESLLPDAARHAGITFSELCCRFVEWALEDAAGEKGC